MSDFYFDHIVCPYCHGRFSHKDVHFRMETFFEEEEDLNKEGKTLHQIKHMPDGPDKLRLMEEVARNVLFLCRDDEAYERFWSDFSGTTEVAYGTDKKLLGSLHPSQLPVLDPNDPEHRKALRQLRDSGKDPVEDYVICDNDGMVIGVEDIYGKQTRRRVCPHCHNPLPVGYGKHETKFICVIGMTQAGKTVYLSQLLKYMYQYVNYVDMTFYFNSDHEPSFVANNPVLFDADYPQALPRPTPPHRMLQPLCFNLVQDVDNGRLKSDTIVLYDIAGENCADSMGMARFGRFVTKSDGIILLLDPSQLGLAKAGDCAVNMEPMTILNTIHSAFHERVKDGKLAIPMAVCISKSDMIRSILPQESQGDITGVRHPSSGDYMKKFNATAYNPLQKYLTEQMRRGAGQGVHGLLCRGYKHFNYFAVSALGCGVEKRDGLSYPEAPPVPQRIAEPLLWLFYQFGYIGSDVPIRLPLPRPMPETVPETVKGWLPFTKKVIQRPLTNEEKERYWYETRT